MEELWVEAVSFGQIRQKCISAASTVAVRPILRSISSRKAEAMPAPIQKGVDLI